MKNRFLANIDRRRFLQLATVGGLLPLMKLSKPADLPASPENVAPVAAAPIAIAPERLSPDQPLHLVVAVDTRATYMGLKIGGIMRLSLIHI